MQHFSKYSMYRQAVILIVAAAQPVSFFFDMPWR